MIKSIIFSSIAGIVGTGLGGVVGTLLGKRSKLFSPIMFLAGGFMLAMVAFELIPDALQKGGIVNISLSFAIGVVFVILGNAFFEKSKYNSSNGNLKTAFMIFLAVAIHNLPEGLAIGGGEAGGMGVAIALLIAIHDVPEGVAMAIPMKASGMKNFKIIGLSALSGVPTAIGGIIGSAISAISTEFICSCLAIASGSMAYVTFAEIFPTAIAKSGKEYNFLFAPLGLLLGLVACYFI